jgi:hypothetical protein
MASACSTLSPVTSPGGALTRFLWDVKLGQDRPEGHGPVVYESSRLHHRGAREW